MKKKYITPEIDVIQLDIDTLCSGSFMVASVQKPDGECVGTFGVSGEDKTKDENKGLWGESNSNNWGDD